MKNNNQKIVINVCFGGFSLSEEAVALYKEKTGRILSRFVDRDDPVLIEVVKELGTEKASGNLAKLKIVEDVPHGVEWEIHEYDGAEHIAEKHRTWD